MPLEAAVVMQCDVSSVSPLALFLLALSLHLLAINITELEINFPIGITLGHLVDQQCWRGVGPSIIGHSGRAD